MEKLGAHIKLCVFRSETLLPVLNIETYDGINEKIEAHGFSEDGKPILRQKPKYPFVGENFGFVDLTRVYRIGTVPDNIPDPAKYKSYLVFGAEAVQVMLGRNSISVDKAWLEEKLDALTENGATCYIWRESAANHMTVETYQQAGFKDKCIISNKHPEQSVEKWNEFLKKLKSPWRVKSEDVEKLLTGKAVRKLLT